MHYTKFLRTRSYQEPEVKEEETTVDEEIVDEEENEVEELPVMDPSDVEVVPQDPVLSGMFNQFVSQNPVNVAVTNEMNVVQFTPVEEPDKPEQPSIGYGINTEAYDKFIAQEDEIKTLKQRLETSIAENSVLSDKIDKLQKENELLAGQNELCNTTILDDSEVDVIMDTLVDLQRKYFGKEGVPLEHEIPFNPRFVKNLPKAVYDGILHSITGNTPDVLNPALMLYFLMCNEPYQSIGLWWKIVLEKLVDGNRETINEDARARLADLGYEEEEYDEDEEIDDEEDVIDE